RPRHRSVLQVPPPLAPALVPQGGVAAQAPGDWHLFSIAVSWRISPGGATMYYVVTEGRARMLDRVDLRDRASYGVDWIVLKASSPRDALRQWSLLKQGVHPTQGEIELETERYRTDTPGFLPIWEAERLAVSSKIERTLDEVQERQRELAGLQDRL